MNFYETLYIVHPAPESGRLKDIILSLEEILKKSGGKTLSINLWGKKRLAYLIDKQKYGTYVQLQFTGEGNCVSNFEIELEHNPNVLSYLTTLIEESDVVEQKNDLDVQIAGQSRETKNDADGAKDKKSVENDKIPLTDTDISESEEHHIEEPTETDVKRASESGDNDPEDKSEVEEMNTAEKNTDSIEENQENADETSAVSEEE